MQLLSHLSVPDENFESMKVKAKVGYVGMLQDGINITIRLDLPPSPISSPTASY